VNYYEHHIGDYDEATAHLTACEDGIYSRLIRKYMATEKPLPAELKALQRLVRARTREEKDAVETVLEEFFELRDDGWHQHRCDETIARYQDKQAKARRSAEARWGAHRTQSDGNANAYADGMRTHCEGNANQAPDTKHQSPNTNQKPSGTASAVGITPRDGTVTGPALSAAMRKHGILAQGSDPRVVKAAENGITPETVEAACLEAKVAKPDERISAGYVLAIAERWTSEASKPPATRVNGRAKTVHDERAEAYAILTGKTSHDTDDRTIDVAATPIA
jgi:uncharacterized protein YdaU (DUF1376 family)